VEEEGFVYKATAIAPAMNKNIKSSSQRFKIEIE
jgi:hypothetical protein